MSWVGALAMGVAALMVAYFLWIYLSSQKLKGQPLDGLERVLPGFAAHRARAVVYCYTEHCGPCRQIGPVIDQLRQQHANLFKLDIEEFPAIARTIGVRATPTTLLVEDGKVLKVLLGANAIRAINLFLQPS